MPLSEAADGVLFTWLCRVVLTVRRLHMLRLQQDGLPRIDPPTPPTVRACQPRTPHGAFYLFVRCQAKVAFSGISKWTVDIAYGCLVRTRTFVSAERPGQHCLVKRRQQLPVLWPPCCPREMLNWDLHSAPNLPKKKKG